MLQHKPYGYGRRGAALGIDHAKQISEQVSRALIAMQLGDVHRHAASLVSAEQLRRRAPTELVLEVEIAERLPVILAAMKQASSASSIVQGGGKRRAGMGQP